MPLSIDADCALTYWMSQHAAKHRPLGNSRGDDLLARFESGSFPDWAFTPAGDAALLATNDVNRIRRNGVSCGIPKVTLPSSSFARTQGGLVVPSPECCYLRLAHMLPLPELAKAGMLLCANFAIDDAGNLSDRHHAPTTTGKIRAYVERANRIHGVKNAQWVLRFLANAAASPPEIDACLLLCLPVMRGGYGCPMPELNGRVRLSARVERSLGYPDCYCDLPWRERRCAVEYTSELHHAGYEKQVKDEIRRAALEAMGYRVFFLTKKQLYNQAAFEGVARIILRTLGRRMPKRTSAHLQAQYDLRKTLLFEPSWIIQRACGA